MPTVRAPGVCTALTVSHHVGSGRSSYAPVPSFVRWDTKGMYLTGVLCRFITIMQVKCLVKGLSHSKCSINSSFITPPLFSPNIFTPLYKHHCIVVSAIIFSQVSPSPISPLTHPPTQAVGQAFVLLPVLILVFPELGTESGRE